MAIVRYYSLGAFSSAKTNAILETLKEVNASVQSLQTEKCFYVQNNRYKQLPVDVHRMLHWILKECDVPDQLHSVSALVASPTQVLIEVGPRFNFSTASSTNSVSICHNLGLEFIERIEVSTRYLVGFGRLVGKDPQTLIASLLAVLHDPMTQCQYTEHNIPVNDFYETIGRTKEDWYFVPILEQGRRALEEINVKNGFAFDDWDLEYYTNLFVNVLKRNPTNVELFDCAQCNSEHSRHWFFKGKLLVDGTPKSQSLIEMICDTQRFSNPNNTVAFSDNSSAIKGYSHSSLRASCADGPGPFVQRAVCSDLIFTAETHNMPTAVSPFSGATTGTGGRLRDVQSIGRGGLPIAGTAGYCVGMLNIPGHKLPYESAQDYPESFARPLKVLIEASDGASDYGNKFGEPLICGFAISFGMVQADGRRKEYVKPIMFSGGVGTMDAELVKKQDPKKGMLLVKIGGPVYRIGVGGGAASSVEVQGDSTNSELDFNAVQRGDAEMENKLNRVVRACIELGDRNPILAIHDQGAGGNCNVLKELVEPGCAGAVIFSKAFQLGDPTISTLELWGAEYQENNAVLIEASSRSVLQAICDRERCPVSFVGQVTGTGHVTLIESEFGVAEKFADRSQCAKELSHVPFDMHLDHVLGKMPQKEFVLGRVSEKVDEFHLTDEVRLAEALGLVLSAPTVGSKRYLTNKVDRSVTGLVAQQQCVGPLHTPLADYGLVAVSHFGKEGVATSIGAQPIKGLVDPTKAARMTVAEALSNLVFVAISELADVKCSGNWMWAAKVPGEGAKLVDACEAMCALMRALQIAIDGGKDSLSMAARVGGETVVSPGTLVVSTYAPCPDVMVKVTPDLKASGLRTDTTLLYVAVEGARFRLGGSVLAQCYGKLGGDCPDISDPGCLKSAFNVTQDLLRKGWLLSGHDCSDGGLITAVLEMAFAGLTSVDVNLEQLLQSATFPAGQNAAVLQVLFAEECGWVVEVASEHVGDVLTAYRKQCVPCYTIGRAVGVADLHSNSSVTVRNGQSVLLQDSLFALFGRWESISFEIEKLQKAKASAVEEYGGIGRRTGPRYVASLNPDTVYGDLKLGGASGPRVALIREEGTNGDREMAAALFSAGFEVHDVAMNDLLKGSTTLDRYRGVVFPGGFSYADTLGSAKGWAACIQYNDKIAPQFEHFRKRLDTFSLGVCNGCQLMGLIGWVETEAEPVKQPLTGVEPQVPEIALAGNRSEKYECRWVTVKIAPSRSLMLRRLTGSVLGCWVAHAEGRFVYRSASTLDRLVAEQCVGLQYVDDTGKPTEVYPMNPNGSRLGVAGVCSPDGRHLAMMPHPERCVQMWQWPYVTADFPHKNASPWVSMFREAYLWCLERK
ncbi:phosphoribosylformylglycinamidine synthase [Anopheles cruzii]|uniref:phosphoribosylformylglycinamidine synthase n=1 Tax=Anopheles cruzii TaxID=68878 RepID=UPI0022EC2704|nr:phosphoribosylformylglycinamidine synthase [Anopheles cruzii]